MDYEYLTELNEFLDDYVHELSEAHDEDHWHKVENLIGALAIVSVSLRRKLKQAEGQPEVEELEEQIEQLTNQRVAGLKTIQERNNEIAELKQQLEQRDNTIADLESDLARKQTISKPVANSKPVITVTRGRQSWYYGEIPLVNCMENEVLLTNHVFARMQDVGLIEVLEKQNTSLEAKLSEKTEVAKPVVEKVGRTGFTVNGNPIIDLWDEDEAKGATSLMNALRHWGVIAN